MYATYEVLLLSCQAIMQPLIEYLHMSCDPVGLPALTLYTETLHDQFAYT